MAQSPSYPSPLLRELQENGFTVIRSLLTPSELTTLRSAADSLTALARAGSWPYIRTVGKQFPPWPSSLPSDGSGIWGVQHLLHPDLPLPQESKDAFIKLYFSPSILSTAKQLLPEGTTDDDLVMELFNMLVRPDKDFALSWHRDDIPATASAEEEKDRLVLPATEEPRYHHTQWNLSLVDNDTSLVLVPKSHTRPRTDEERAADPFEPNLPGQLVVELNAGDVAFYDNNILHRGVYSSQKERTTLHGSVGHVAGASSGKRARNVLQHGVGEWVERCDFSALGERGEEARERAEGMRERLVRMGRENKDVGFSLDG
ncbi:phytanoyl-CoA dioxygenase [Neurospora intermedia]|uniref:Phytanoyl-CoA dioxygenase n=1 Tax=Neurospora intermedia TaxID=5142 RepID=A0ABR3DA18_NEUIN